MILWLLLATMTAGALALLLMPLLRKGAAAESRAAYDLAVYRDQLAEIERDLERGLLGPEEAVAARTEIERRMLAAADGQGERPKERGGDRAITAAVIAAALPLGAFVLYLNLGSPELPGRPFAERQAERSQAVDDPAVQTQVAELVEHLRQDPEDLEAWLALAESYMVLERHGSAANAYRHAILLAQGRPDVFSAYGESLVHANDGQVTSEARTAFGQALAAAPDEPRARYYLALAEAQAGNQRTALQMWVDLAADSPPDAPWLPILDQHIGAIAEELGIEAASIAPAPRVGRGPSPEDMAALEQMSPEDQADMIRTMVERLAAQLEAEPDDPDGWLMLARSYQVLGDPGQARHAFDRAARLAANGPPALKARIQQAGRELGFDLPQ
jgi:cytochrome c-type biogenesis protein CcmH